MAEDTRTAGRHSPLRWARWLIAPRANVFLSYAKAQRHEAVSIAAAIRASGHEVFFDRDVLTEGEAFDPRIRQAIESADIFVFLVSPDSLADHRYSLTELDIARERWPQPGGHVLPVMVVPVAMERLPPDLRVTVLERRGDLPAQVAAAVTRLARRQRLWLRRTTRAVLAAVALLALKLGYDLADYVVQVRPLLVPARVQRDAGHYAEAWDLYQGAMRANPGSRPTREEMEDLGMRWLEDDKALEEPDAVAQIEREVVPALDQAAGAADSSRKADLLAHLGWAEYRKLQAETAAQEVQPFFRKALDVDPNNPFAHAMWAYFWVERTNKLVPDAQEHFEAALASGRERPYVRHLQIAAMTRQWFGSDALQPEAMRIATAMRNGGEVVSPNDRRRLFRAYCNLGLADALRSSPDAAELLKTFQWLARGAEEPMPPCIRFALASLQEATGAGREALAAYRAVQSELSKPEASSLVQKDEIWSASAVAITRLQDAGVK